MWISYLKKKNLLDLLKNQEPFDIAPIVEKDELKPIFKDQDTVLLIWSSKPTKLNFFPCLICLPNNTTREFLAWVNTYIPSIKPFTAYCKVIEEENLSNSCFNDISCGNLEFLEKTIVGIIIAEILTHLENKDLKRISPIAVKSTLSYTLANSYFVGLHENLLKILNSWMKLQKISNQRPRTLSPNYIVEVWNIITSLNNSAQQYTIQITGTDKKIFQAADNLMRKGNINKTTWKALTKNIRSLKDLIDISDETREERVIIFENKFEFLCNSKQLDRKTSSFISAFLVSQIDPGSMRYVDIIIPHLKKFPDMLLWYGLISGLYGKSGLYNERNGMGWRIRRDLLGLRDSSLFPKADISFDELEMLHDVGQHNTSFITESHTHILVELIPSIYSLVLWPPLTHKRESEKQLELFSDEKEKMKDPLVELSELLKKANELLKMHSRNRGKSNTRTK